MSNKKSNSVTLTSLMQAAKEVAGIAEPEPVPKKKKKKRSKPKPDTPTEEVAHIAIRDSASGSAPKPVKKKSSKTKKVTEERAEVRERAPESKPDRDDEHHHKHRSRKHKHKHKSRHRSRSRPRRRHEHQHNPDEDKHLEDVETPAPKGYPSGAKPPEIVPEDQILPPEGYPTQEAVEEDLEGDDHFEDRYAEEPGPVVQNPVVEHPDSENNGPHRKDRPTSRHDDDDDVHTESGGEGGISEDIDNGEMKKRKSSKRRGKRNKRDRKDRGHRERRREEDGFTRHPSGGQVRPLPDMAFLPHPHPPTVPVPLGQPIAPLSEHGRSYMSALEANNRRMQERAMHEHAMREEALREEEHHMRRMHRSRSRHEHREHRHRDRPGPHDQQYFEAPYDHHTRRRSHSRRRNSRSRGDGHGKRKTHRSRGERERDYDSLAEEEPQVVAGENDTGEREVTRGLVRNSSQRSAGSGAGSGVLGKLKSAASGLKAAVKDAVGETGDSEGEEKQSRNSGKSKGSGSRRSHVSQKSGVLEEVPLPKPDLDDGSDGTAPSGGEESPHEQEQRERRRRKSKDRPRRKHSKKDGRKHGTGGKRGQTHQKRDGRNDRPRLLNEDESILAEERALTRRRSRKQQHHHHHRVRPLDEDGSAAEEERAILRHRSKHRYAHDADTLDSLSSRRAREVMRGADASPAVTLNVLERFLPARSIPELKKARERAEEEGFLELPEMGENESLAEDALVREAKTSAFRVQVPQNFSYIVERWSKYRRRLDAGWHGLLPFIDRVSFVHSLKEEPMTIPPHQSFTRDSVPVHTAGMLFVKVTDPVAASYAVENPYRSLLLLAQACVTQSVGKRLLRDAIVERPELGKSIVDEINDQARTWGLWVSRVELTELEPPPETRAMLQYEGEAHMQTGLQLEREVVDETHDELAAIYKTHNAASRVDENTSQGSGWRGAGEEMAQRGVASGTVQEAGSDVGVDPYIGSGWRGSRVEEAALSQSSAKRAAPTIRSESETTYDPFLDDAVSEHAVLGARWFTGATAPRRARGEADAGTAGASAMGAQASGSAASTWEGLPPNRHQAGSNAAPTQEYERVAMPLGSIPEGFVQVAVPLGARIPPASVVMN